MCDRIVKAAQTANELKSIEQKIQCQLTGRVRDLNLILSDDGLVVRGCVRSYYSKQLAQHAVMKLTKLPIRAN